MSDIHTASFDSIANATAIFKYQDHSSQVEQKHRRKWKCIRMYNIENVKLNFYFSICFFLFNAVCRNEWCDYSISRFDLPYLLLLKCCCCCDCITLLLALNICRKFIASLNDGVCNVRGRGAHALSMNNSKQRCTVVNAIRSRNQLWKTNK